jgi:hypothetical protein
MLNIHCKFEGGTVSMFKCFLVYGSNMLIVEFGALHNFSHLLYSVCLKKIYVV